MGVWRRAFAVLAFLGGALAEAHAKDRPDLDTVLNKIVPPLAASSKVGRLYYRASSCTMEPPGTNPASFPPVRMLLRPKGEVGLAAVRDVFRDNANVTVKENPAGIVRIRIGTVSDAILQTRISLLTLRPMAQYNVRPAIDAILETKEMQGAMRRLGVKTTTPPYDMIMQSPMAGVPHLHSSMRNVTVDEALDAVAKTFRVIVRYGACDRQGIFGIYFERIHA